MQEKLEKAFKIAMISPSVQAGLLTITQSLHNLQGHQLITVHHVEL